MKAKAPPGVDRPSTKTYKILSCQYIINKETGANTLEPVSTYKILLSMEPNKTSLQK